MIPTLGEMADLYRKLRSLPPSFQNLVINVLRHWSEQRKPRLN
jgi:hypothetical protein